MEALKQRPAAAAKKRSRADSFKQFVSTRRGAYTVAVTAAALPGSCCWCSSTSTRTT